MLGAAVDQVPAALAVASPDLGNGRLGAVGGATVSFFVDEPVASATGRLPGAGVVLHRGKGTESHRRSPLRQDVNMCSEQETAEPNRRQYLTPEEV